MNKKILAIIPARGGSKRLPFKNILDLDGKPLIEWTINAAKDSTFINKIIVTSDDEKILDISNKLKVDTLKRPENLALDTSTTLETINHVLDNITEKYDYIILLQATSPLRTSTHIDESINLLFNKKANAVISVCEMEHSPLWANTLDETLDMSNFLKEEVKNKRSQDLEKYFRLNGAIYICQVDEFIKQKTFFLKEKIYAYEMDKLSSIDIDEKLDFELAKVIKNIAF